MTRPSTRTPLRSINLDIKEGEFIVSSARPVAVHPGCGMIAGLEDITSGELTRRSLHERRRRWSATWAWCSSPTPSTRTYEHLREHGLGPKLKKMDKESIHKRVMRAAEILG